MSETTLAQPDWTPEYSPWRHGGWYVNNISYPSGAVGCISRNYSDKKWRIVCEADSFPGSPDDRTWRNRDAAARAEKALADALLSLAPECAHCGRKYDPTHPRHTDRAWCWNCEVARAISETKTGQS